MSGRETDGRAESIRQRLRNEFRARGEDVTLDSDTRSSDSCTGSADRATESVSC